MDNLVVVGCGDHYRSNVAPSLAIMEAAQEAKVIATVDCKPFDGEFVGLAQPVPHIVRLPGKSLVTCLSTFRDQDPVVLLAHSHDWHARDALDLVSGGFRVILEKPYAIRPSEMSAVRELVGANPARIALAEYYLMMKAAPLLHAAGLLQPNSFYVAEQGYLQVEAAGSTLQNTFGILQNIGRPRMVFVDILEGEGATGRFEHRGLQFADTRVGIGVILDLALHALAPLFALEGLLGRIPPASRVAVGRAVCNNFLRFAETTYQVPAEFVPETYAELAFTTSTGVPVIICVGKYVLPNANQRRVLILGDEGEALLDLSSCTLSLACRDHCPSPVLSSPKRPESKYRAVLRACLLALRGVSPYSFNPSAVAIRSNDLALTLYSRASEETTARHQYPAGAAPGTILKTPVTSPASDVPKRDLKNENDAAEVYYKHQYDRMTSLEDQAFKMSGGVLVLTAAVFTLLSRNDMTTSVLPWEVVIGVMSLANLAAILYLWRVNDSGNVHRRRAKAVLERAWPSLWAIDQRFPQRFAGRVQLRPLIQIALHLVLVAAGLWELWRWHAV